MNRSGLADLSRILTFFPNIMWLGEWQQHILGVLTINVHSRYNPCLRVEDLGFFHRKKAISLFSFEHKSAHTPPKKHVPLKKIKHRLILLFLSLFLTNATKQYQTPRKAKTHPPKNIKRSFSTRFLRVRASVLLSRPPPRHCRSRCHDPQLRRWRCLASLTPIVVCGVFSLVKYANPRQVWMIMALCLSLFFIPFLPVYGSCRGCLFINFISIYFYSWIRVGDRCGE